MIKEGCLEGVDEVYGIHNIPQFPEGEIRVCEGPFFAGTTVVKITIDGTGGHGSLPHLCASPLSAASQVLAGLHTIKSSGINATENFVFKGLFRARALHLRMNL